MSEMKRLGRLEEKDFARRSGALWSKVFRWTSEELWRDRERC